MKKGSSLALIALCALLSFILLDGCDAGNGNDSYDVPFAEIQVDGSGLDWSGIPPAITDPSGDAGSIAGSDITAIYLARDSQNIYVRIDVANGPPSSTLYFGVSFYPQDYYQSGDRFVFIDMQAFLASVESRRAGSGGYHDIVASGVLAIQGTVIELSVRFQDLNPPARSHVEGWDDISGPSIDSTSSVTAVF